MKSPITKLAAAACVVVVLVGWWLFLGPEMVQSAYAELNQAIENSTNTEWMHHVSAIYHRVDSNGVSTWIERKKKPIDDVESWLSFRPSKYFRKWGDGRIEFIDFAKRRGYSYNPERKIVTIGYENASDLTQDFDNLYEMMQLRVPKGDHVIKRVEEINEKRLTVFREEESGEGYTEWFVDSKTKRVVGIEEVDVEQGEKRVEVLDYPEDGPENIYALGVPNNATVVNELPPREIEELVNKARAAENGFPQDFFSVECKMLKSFEGLVPSTRNPNCYMPFTEDTRLYNLGDRTAPAAVITIVYCKNGNCRREIYPVWITKYSTPEGYRKQLKKITKIIPTDSLGALEAWTKNRLPNQIIVCIRRKMHVFQRGEDGTLKSRSDPDRYDSRDRAAMLNINFWRPPNNRYDLDHYCADLGEKPGRWGELVGITIGDEQAECYFNPARNFICECVLVDHSGPAPWRGHTRTVLEYAKTSCGRWYPRRTRAVWDKTTYLFVNFVDDNRRIDQKLFNHDVISVADLAPFAPE